MGLIEILRFSCQICFGSSASVVAKSISFIVSMFYIEVPLCTFNWSLWWNYLLTHVILSFLILKCFRPQLLTEVCDEIIYWLLIILSFLNLKCLRPLFVFAFFVSFMGVSYFWNLFLMTKCWRFSLLSWLYFLLVEILGRA